MNAHHAIDDLKEAVQLFFDTLKASGSQDRVGLVIYSTEAKLKMGLSSNYDAINKLAQSEKADGWTNIGDGMMAGRLELLANGRAGAQKMMVVMTDGHVNRPANKDPRQWVLTQAQLSAAEGVELVTISFGSDPDKGLMIQVAETSPGDHFLVSGSVKQQEKQIRKVFYRIATYRTTVLVQ